MKQLFIVANWKENKTQSQAAAWLAEFSILNPQFSNKTVVVCSPFTALSEMKKHIDDKQLSIYLGSQNISQFVSGAHTGEESGEMLKEIVTYTIIGHSERRKMGETNEMVNEKIARAMENGLTPIICVSNKEQTHNLEAIVQSSQVSVNSSQLLVAFEPLDAIGTGNAEDPKSANDVAQKIKNRLGNVLVLYGGSVTAENVHSFTSQEQIDGVLVGGASLDPKAFSAIIQSA